jgi:Icc-related predicted phosphoesterase
MAKSFTRLFFATDVHGSEACFLKFLNAGKFYKADVLIMGGDITGKVIVPISKLGGGRYKTQFMGNDVHLESDGQLAEFMRKVQFAGQYPYVTEEKELAELKAKSTLRDALFGRLMKETLRRWVAEAERRLRGSGILCFLSPGNDDSFEIDEVLSSSDVIQCPEGKVIGLPNRCEMISTGFANITPWQCPRDIPEEQLRDKIEKMAAEVDDMSRCIFNLHAPPYGSGLDTAPELDATLKPTTKAGTVITASVGSTAVRDAILQHQPMLGLHGHIHESRATHRYGRTLCCNPGSEYTEGILRGVLIVIDDKGVKNDMFTSG